jgi:ABC-2 type transport system permease protein
MLALIIKKEIQDIIRSQKFVWAFFVTSLLILLSFYVGGQNFHLQQRSFESARSENLRQMKGITDWAMIKHHVYLPPDPLYTLVNGIDNDIARNTEMFAIGELQSNDSRYMQEPLFAAFRFLDLQFLFVVVMTLFGILFGYNLINGEKENGTLRLVFANALPKDKFILGKLIGAFVAVVLPLLLPVLLGYLILIILGVPMNSDAWLRLTAIIMCGLLLFSFFLISSIFFSALTEKSALSFLYMIVVWIFFVFIWPKSSVLIAGRAVDVPSVDEVAFKKASFRSQVWAEEMKKIAAYQAPLTDDFDKMFEDFNKFMNDLSNERNEKTSKFNEKLNQERSNRQNVRQTTAFSISRFSPVADFTLAAIQMAGSGLSLKERYAESLKRYQDSYASFLRQFVDGPLPGAGMRMRMVTDDQATEPIDTSLLPVYTFDKNSIAADMSQAALGVALLIIFNLLAFSAAVLRFLRFDVR